MVEDRRLRSPGFAHETQTVKAALLVVLLAASQTYAHPGWGIGLNSRGDVFSATSTTRRSGSGLSEAAPRRLSQEYGPTTCSSTPLTTSTTRRRYTRGSGAASGASLTTGTARHWCRQPSTETPTGEHTLVDAAGSIFFRGARRIRKRSPDGQVEILADGLADITARAWAGRIDLRSRR